MPGSKAFRKLQFGREVTPGTKVAATTVWRGIGALDDLMEATFVEEDIGVFSGGDRSYVPKYEGQLSLESIEANYQQFPHILEMGIKTVTPTADGVGSGKIYTYTFPTTAPNTIKTYTIEGGDNQQAEVMEYCFCKEFTLEGAAGEAWKLAAVLGGRQVAPQAFTGSVAIPAIEDMLFQKSKLYVDAIGGTWGTTLVSDTLLAGSLSVNTGIIAKWVADGNLYFNFIQYTRPEVVLSLTLEHNATAVTEKANWKSQLSRLIQLKIEGSALTTPGTSYTYHTVKVNLAGKWRRFEPLGDQDGNSIYVAEFVSRYNPTAAKFGEIIVVNELASLP